MTAIDSVPVPTNDIESASTRARTGDFAIFGTASPPMAAGAMLLMFNLAIALFVVLGPIFILCLLFEQTKPLFNKWLLYGIGTLFAMATLSFISGVVLKVTINVAEGLWAASTISGLVGAQSEGITTQSMEQGGIGLLLTMLIISAPPMAAQFFNGTLGSFMAYSAFNGAGARPGPQGQPAGSYAYGGGGQGPAQASTAQTNAGQQISGGAPNNLNLGRMPGNASTSQADIQKTAAQSAYGAASNPPPTTKG